MTGPMEDAVQARARLVCDRCDASWVSHVYKVVRAWGQYVDELAPAFARGWRVYAAGRGQRTYCPDCEPTVPMRQVLPR